MADETMNVAEKKRFFILSIALLLVAAIVTVSIVYFSTRPSDTTIKSSFALTAADKASVEKISKEFINRAGTWGLRDQKIDPKTFETVAYNIQRNTQTAPTYWYSRNEAYLNLRQEFIAPGSYLWYGESTVQKWWDNISRESLASFKTLSVTPTVPDNGSRLTLDENKEYDAVTVPIKYSIRERRYIQSATDVSWDGTFIVSKRVYEVDAQLVLVKMADGWKVYQITGNRYPFLLNTWATPDNDYNADQFGFEEESRFNVKNG